MNYENDKNRGFTLVEMIVVMGIIALLAAMIFPITGVIHKRRTLARAKAELLQLEMDIRNYNTKLGHYPPDNPANATFATQPQSAITNSLYYELLGTQLINNGASYQTMDGSAQISTNSVPTTFGVGGFVNCSRGGGDEAQPAIRFSSGFRAGEYVDLGYRLLGYSADGPVALPDSTGRKISPFWYNCTNPTNNPGSYDLWLDIKVGSKVYRISNWSATAVTL